MTVNGNRVEPGRYVGNQRWLLEDAFDLQLGAAVTDIGLELIATIGLYRRTGLRGFDVTVMAMMRRHRRFLCRRTMGAIVVGAGSHSAGLQDHVEPQHSEQTKHTAA